MSSQARKSPELEIPPDPAADVVMDRLRVNVRGHQITMREADDGAVWLKVELDGDGELQASPADLRAIESWVRRFLLMVKER